MNQHGRARNARLNQAMKFAVTLVENLSTLRGESSNKIVDHKDAWADGRNALEQLTQCFHEANAYNNALLAQRREQSPSKRQVVGSNPTECAISESTDAE